MTPAAWPPPFSAGFATHILTPQSSLFHLVPAIPASAIKKFLEER
jgi:hypothetical protein